MGRGCEAVFDLNCLAGPVALRENYTFSRRELGRIHGGLGVHITMLCEAWEKVHGSG